MNLYTNIKMNKFLTLYKMCTSATFYKCNFCIKVKNKIALLLTHNKCFKKNL